VQTCALPICNDIFLGKHLLVHWDIKTQFFIHSVTTYLTQIISLVAEEKFVDNSTSSFLIGRFGITQLSIYMFYRFLFRVGWIFLQSIMDNGIICRSEEHTSELQSRENLVCRLL